MTAQGIRTLVRDVGVTLAVLVAFVGCQTPVPSTPARLSVVVHKGFGVPTAPLGSSLATIALLVDVRGGDGTDSLQRARVFLEAVPEGNRVRAYVVGHNRSESCDGGELLDPPDRTELATRLGGLDVSGSGSLAAALEKVRADAQHAAERLVVFSAGLDDSCSDVCAAAQQVADAGIWQDWIVPPDASLPSCLSELAPRIERAGSLAEELTLDAPKFQVHEGTTPEGGELAKGRSGEDVSLEPGDVTLKLDLSPAEVVGPLRLRSGERIRVVVVDFPMTEPPLRTWWIERKAGGTGP